MISNWVLRAQSYVTEARRGSKAERGALLGDYAVLLAAVAVAGSWAAGPYGQAILELMQHLDSALGQVLDDMP